LGPLGGVGGGEGREGSAGGAGIVVLSHGVISWGLDGVVVVGRR